MKINFLHLENIFIYEQLQIEEALLRTSDENWVILNSQSKPAVVMGLSQKKEEVVHPNTPFPIIQRFSGGGCVLVNEATLFLSLIINKKDLAIKPYPEPMYRYVLPFLQSIFLPEIHFKQNDYVIGNRKCIGNAQAITKDKLLHHMSILYDLDWNQMDYLKLPKLIPEYREKRSHQDFLCSLKEYGYQKEHFVSDTFQFFSKNFECKEFKLSNINSFLEKTHRKSTKMIQLCYT